MKANERQIGGTHYKTAYEHWDLAIFVPLGYLEGSATKYVSRWRKKGGIQDLYKALHYHEKLIENYEIIDLISISSPEDIQDRVQLFAKSNGLSAAEEEYVLAMCTFSTVEDLREARDMLIELIAKAKIESPPLAEPNIPGTPENGGQHSRQE